MKTKREINNAELKALNTRLRRWGHAPIDFNHYMEIKGTMSNLTDRIMDLLENESRVLIEFLYISSTVHDFNAAIAPHTKEEKKFQILMRWLNIIEKKQEENLMFSQGNSKGREELENELKEKDNEIKWYSVKDFAELVKLHPHTIRTYFKAGKLRGRQDTKRIFIDASELEKYI